ncbi:hypothetical protein [Roseateles sp.]|uniref:hypothetical protein n=1 Tax=Roseateles sp. TaxID=1971397 RepID=UPI0031E00DF9
MSQSSGAHDVTPEIVQEALANPEGWVYKIEGTYSATEYVPPEAIVGAWKVDAHGKIVGDFIPNPKYQEGVSKAGK